MDSQFANTTRDIKMEEKKSRKFAVILVAAAGIAILMLVAGVILSHRKATVFTIAILASDPDRIDCGALEEQFTETAGTEDHPLTVSVTAYDPAEKENDQKLLADLRSHIVDLLIAEETVFTVFADRQCFGSLKDVLPADWPKGYYRWVPNGYPAYGIRIPDSGRIGMPDEKRYQYVAGISIASEHKEAAARVLLSLL